MGQISSFGGGVLTSVDISQPSAGSALAAFGIREFLSRLQQIVGEANVVFHPDDLLVFEYDGSIDRGMPRAVVFPLNTHEVSRVMALCYEGGVPVVGRGSGTGLSGGAISHPDGIQIAFTRMNRILEVDRENRHAVVEPGVINLDLDTHVRRYGMRYAPDPSSQRACSLGGNIAENAGGPHCLAYGTTTNHVLGMEVVLEDGAVVHLGSLARETPGYDLRGVFTGSEGTFGIATRIMVRLLPVPEAVKTYLGIFPDVESACTAVSTVIGHGIVPAALEMIDALSIRAVQNVSDAGYPDDAGAVLLIELEGLTDEVDEIGLEVEASLWDTGASQVKAAAEAAEREQLWKGRKGALGALGSLAPNYYLVDGVVPRTQLATVLQQVAEVGRRHGIEIANVFHAGRRQPAPVPAVRRAGAGGAGEDNRRRGRGAGGLRGRRGDADRRARRGAGEEGADAAGVHRGGYGGDAEGTGSLRAEEQHQPGQNLPRRPPPPCRGASPGAGDVCLEIPTRRWTMRT